MFNAGMKVYLKHFVYFHNWKRKKLISYELFNNIMILPLKNM